MPAALSYPGVYVEEIPSGIRTIAGVATAISAFVGRTARGPTNQPVTIASFGDFERSFGGLQAAYSISYAVRDFFLNGGGQAIVVRLAHNGAAAELALSTSAEAPNDVLTLLAADNGSWGNQLTVTVDHQTRDASDPQPDPKLFNLVVAQPGGQAERFLNVSIDPADPRFLPRVLADGSGLVRAKPDGAEGWVVPNIRPKEGKFAVTTDGGDGGGLTDTDYLGSQAKKTGIFALEQADLFNLLCLPPDTRGGDTPPAVYQAALSYCVERRAMLIVDPPAAWRDASAASAGLSGLGLNGMAARNAALYFPRVVQADPLRDGQLDTFAPCGIIAGIIARTDAQRGVWKAPAGLDAGVAGVQGLAVNLTDAENGLLNPQGINCLRSFPASGRVVWGARTLRGADQLADEYKYLPVRRLVLYLEESLYRGTKWVVFEPNDEPLWAQIRLNLGGFMHTLFRQGAFQGKSPQEAYFVKCDSETTTPTDIGLGIVNIVVGFAPLRPAEFVIIKFQQIAGQSLA